MLWWGGVGFPTGDGCGCGSRGIPTGALWDAVSTDILHVDVLGFAKTYIGLACALAVYSWSDSLPNVHFRERTLVVARHPQLPQSTCIHVCSFSTDHIP